MSETFLDGKVILHCGDCLEVLATLPDNHFDSVVCDPPYGLEFMGKAWDGADGFRRSLNLLDAGRESVMGRMSQKAPEYKAGHLFQEWCEAWAAQVLRVLKPGGFMVAFSSTRTYHRMTCAIEDAGFEVRDMIAWMYGSGFPKSLNVSKAIDKEAGAERSKVRHDKPRNPKATGGGRDGMEGATRPWIEKAMEVGYHELDSDIPATPAAEKWQGWGTALKPAIEPICLARKPLGADTVAGNVLQYGTGGLNVNGCRIEGESVNIRIRHNNVSLGAVSTGVYGSRGGPCEVGSALGRWPANVVHDGSAEVVEAFPETGPASGSIRNCKAKPISAAKGREYDRASFGHEDGGGSAARFFYTVKPDLNPICLARKPLSEGTVAENVLTHGVGGINVDGCRVEGEDAEAGRVRHGGGSTWDGSGFTDIKAVMPSGRWPANVIHDGSQEVVENFPDTVSGGGSVKRASAKGGAASASIGKESRPVGSVMIEHPDKEGSAARFFYEVKPDLDPICLARKPLSEDTVAENVLKHGVGGINVDGCRIDAEVERRLCGKTETESGQTSFKTGAREETHTSEGRWPANVIHDGSSEVVGAFPETEPSKASERGLQHSGRHGGLADVGGNIQEGTDSVRGHTDSGGSVARFFYEVKPDLDPICLARKPLSEDTVAENVLKHGTGGLNVDGCRVESSAADQEYMRAQLGGFNNTKSIGGKGSGILGGGKVTDRSEFDPSKGRWPANVVTDGSPEVVGAFPEADGATSNGRKGKPQANCYGDRGAQEQLPSYADSGSAARFFYTAKAGNDDRLGSIHPTVKPIDLMQWLIRLVTPKGGLCLDQFAGTGTTGEAAYLEGMRCELIEKDPNSQEDIRKRMGLVLAGPRTRKQATVKAKIKSGRVKDDAGPLFTMAAVIDPSQTTQSVDEIVTKLVEGIAADMGAVGCVSAR